MKKILSCILIITLFIGLMGAIVYAGNGPLPADKEYEIGGRAYIIFYNQEGYKTLQEGQYVEFNLLETSKGYQALNVSVVKPETIS